MCGASPRNLGVWGVVGAPPQNTCFAKTINKFRGIIYDIHNAT